MDDDDEQQRHEPAPNRRGKAKFAPKAPPRRKPKAEVEENISVEDEAAQAQELMAKFTKNLTRKVPKSESKASPQVAFGPGATSSPSIRKFGVPQGKNTPSGSVMKDYMDVDNDSGGIVTSSSSTIKDGAAAYPSVLGDESSLKVHKDYKEPWDYHRSYYPTTLPLREPYSGDPEPLNEAEFGEAARNLEYDENTIKPASDVVLLEDCDSKKMILFQLPPSLPLLKRSASAKGKESAESSMSSERKKVSEGSSLEALSEGYMGKMLVYRSGAVKLKLGDVLYEGGLKPKVSHKQIQYLPRKEAVHLLHRSFECSLIYWVEYISDVLKVTPGSDFTFAQEVMAINTAAKHCCAIGVVGKRAVVSPDVDFLLNSVIDLD